MTRLRAHEVDHLVDRLLGGDPKFTPRPGVPAGGRAECRRGPRPCEYVRCRMHLWLILGPERTGTWGGLKGGTTLRAGWLETPVPPSCALDIADAVEDGETLPYEELGPLIHLDPDRAQHVVSAALRVARRRMLSLDGAASEAMTRVDWPIEVDPVFGCHRWLGRRDPRDGRAMIWSGTLRSAYVIAWERVHGALPAGKELDHLCRRPDCVNELHLELVTREENERRKLWRYRVKRLLCPRGHALKENAVVTETGGRMCRTCIRTDRGEATPA